MLMNEHEHSTICRNVNVLRRRLRSFKITDKLRIVIAFCIVNLNQFIYLSMSQNCMVVVMEIGVAHFYVKKYGNFSQAGILCSLGSKARVQQKKICTFVSSVLSTICCQGI